jgi:NAD(P)-dependent dehydrogenase (short-subunit alcohol dehydrogenase family)
MGKVAVITGASAGVGRATARAFAARGYHVGLLARGSDGLRGAAAEVEAAGRRALAVATDVSSYEEVESAAGRVESSLGPIDVWVNDAMATIFAPFQEIEPEEYRRSTEVTYLGAVWGTHVALARMRSRGRGVVVQVGSALAFRGIPLQAPYCGAKHAIKGFTESVRSELLHEGSNVRVRIVHLPALNTPQFDIGRNKMPKRPQPVPPIYEPEVAADAIVWAAQHSRRQLFVGVPTLKTVWGNKLAPQVADWYLARNGYSAQLTDDHERERPDNLFEPVPGDQGAHGRFRGVRGRSVQLAASKHRRALGVAAAAVLGGGLAAAAAARR